MTNFLEILSSMRNFQHHDTFILHDFEDPFMQKESARDETFKFFKFVSPTISAWAQQVPQGMPNFIFNRTLEYLLHGSEPWNYGSMMYMEEHQPITFPQVEFAQDYTVHCSIDWNSRTSSL